MEPKREPGDDRVMWHVRPVYFDGKPSGAWSIMEGDASCVADMLDGASAGSRYEVWYLTVTAEAWNEMPEFEGW